MNELDVIRMGKLKNNVFILPPKQLDRALYVKVKDLLEGIGGKWNRKAQGFVFLHNPGPLINKILQKNTKINIRKDYQLFETPPGLVKRMISLADLKPSDLILEPSAGRGMIADLLPKGSKVAVVELMPENRQILKIKGYPIIGNDFLKLPTRFVFDKIIANPPFSKQQDIDHIMKMYSHLKPNGRLVALSSPGWTFNSFKKAKDFREFLNKAHARVYYIPEKTFKESGTTISSVLIVIDKKPFPLKPLNRDFGAWISKERSKAQPVVKEEVIDMRKTWNEVEKLEAESRKRHAEMRKIMRDLGYLKK